MSDETESMRGYARSRRARGLPGGSLRAVQRARDAGRLVMTSDNRVLVAASDALWARTATDPDGELSAHAPAPAPAPAAPPAPLTSHERRYYAEYAGLTAAELKAEILRIRTARERADLDVHMGSLHKTAECAAAITIMMMEFRDAVLSEPDRRAERDAVDLDVDAAALYERDTRMLRDLCNRLADMWERRSEIRRTA